jgi:hypothetical protein
MGGFVYHGDNGPLRTLSLQDIEELVKKDEIEYPIITKEEIKDRSKGDALTKGLVLIQTTWFLLQCVARGVQHLSLTKLELATAAFALLNIVTYALWWDKPLNVHCPVQVSKKHVCGQGGGGEVASGKKETSQGDSQQRSEAVAEGVREHTTFANRVRDWWSSFWRSWSSFNVGKAIVTVFGMAFRPIWLMMVPVEGENDDTFFVGENENYGQRGKANYCVVVISMVFGH